MGKHKKLKVAKKEKQPSLAEQIESGHVAKPSGRIKKKLTTPDSSEYVDAKLSKKILERAREQQKEEEEEMSDSEPQRKTTKLDNLSDQSDVESEPEMDGDYIQDFEVNDEDERALEQFMNKNPEPRRTLADLIMEKITEKGTEMKTQFTEDGSVNHLPEIDPKIKVEAKRQEVKKMDHDVTALKIEGEELKFYVFLIHFRGVRDVLAKYRSGKLPKAFKMMPRLKNWEEILYITEPEKWSAAAMYQATRIFASNLSEKMAQRFYNLVLYPRIRDDIAEYKRLNFHLYQALRKALFKPAAFMKGIILPLCESGTCTLREAIVIGSVIAKSSIPILHSASAILMIAEMEYSGANSIFLRIFLDKKYALPYRVVDGVVGHFLRFERDKRELPVLWHQSLLTFVQRYKQDISSEQREALLNLLRQKSHYMITPEVRRELQHAKCRDIEDQPVEMDFD